MRDDDLRRAQIAWAHEYNGYDRFVHIGKFRELLAPADDEFRRTGRVPEWCGVDYLRAWAFIIARADLHAGGHMFDSDNEDVVHWDAILRAIHDHPAATLADRPPLAPGTGDGTGGGEPRGDAGLSDSHTEGARAGGATRAAARSAESAPMRA